MKPYIYLRGLRHVDLSVFCVESGQKNYWDPIFNVRVPFSSGQQVKRSILEAINDELHVDPSPITFAWEGVSLKEKEVTSLCDPQYYDQLFGGWMNTNGTEEEKMKKAEKGRTLKRRSPLSISAMRPLHPLLGQIFQEKISFDRRDRPEIHKVVVRDTSGNAMSEEAIEELLAGTNRSLYHKWIQKDSTRATGLFVYDVAIDLRTLFAVSVNQMEPELKKEKIDELREKGWVSSRNVFGECLIMPKENREIAIPAIAKALINWRISSNQSRTFSLMETLAIAISDNANTLAGAIRTKLVDDSEKAKAKPMVDETAGAELFVTLPCSGYMVTETESADALQRAEERLIDLLFAFDYENQK